MNKMTIKCLTPLQLPTLIMKLAILGVSVSVQRRYIFTGSALQCKELAQILVLPYSVLIFKTAVHACVIYTRWKIPTEVPHPHTTHKYML